MSAPKYPNITVHLTDREISPFRAISAVATAMALGQAALSDVNAVRELEANEQTVDELRKWVNVK